MKIVIFGLAITSSWGNGHASTFRALCRGLHDRGHHVIFFEQDAYWYADNRDLPEPLFCEMRIFGDWQAVLAQARNELRDADVAILGSYCPFGRSAAQEIFDCCPGVKAFYDIDTPITVGQLRRHGSTDYLRADQVPGFDIYFSFTGGPMLRELESRFSARLAVPLYCAFDPGEYCPRPVHKRYASELSYMGTYAPDRQPKLRELLCEPALRLPDRRFLVAGPQYPRSVKWPTNVRRINHLNPRWHPAFYSSSRLTLNVTRRDMVMAGYSPSVRLFEAAACGATIVSDSWPGLSDFFIPGREILLPSSGEDVFRYLTGYDDAELKRIGAAARCRVLEEHSSDRRALQFEQYVAAARSSRSVPAVAAD